MNNKYVGKIVLLGKIKCKVVAQSPRTGSLTLSVLEDITPYKAGDKINAAAYEVALIK